MRTKRDSVLFSRLVAKNEVYFFTGGPSQCAARPRL